MRAETTEEERKDIASSSHYTGRVRLSCYRGAGCLGLGSAAAMANFYLGKNE